MGVALRIEAPQQIRDIAVFHRHSLTGGRCWSCVFLCCIVEPEGLYAKVEQRIIVSVAVFTAPNTSEICRVRGFRRVWGDYKESFN